MHTYHELGHVISPTQIKNESNKKSTAKKKNVRNKMSMYILYIQNYLSFSHQKQRKTIYRGKI